MLKVEFFKGIYALWYARLGFHVYL